MTVDIKQIEKKVDGLSRQARIDKLVLSNVVIKDIADFETLEKKGILNNSNTNMKYMTATGKQFTSLIIQDDYFGKLKAGIYASINMQYGILFTSVKNSIGNNLLCHSVAGYNCQIEETKKYLTDTYGIYADFDYCKISSIEINRTFRINNQFAEYKRVLELIAWNIPKIKRMNITKSINLKTGTGFEAGSFYITSKKSQKTGNGTTKKSRQYEEIIFYRKSKQIEPIMKLSGEYMRIEITLAGSTKIKKLLGTDRFYRLSDIMVNNFFDSEVQNLVIKPYEKWKTRRDKQLLKLMKQQRHEDIRNWIVNTILVAAKREIENGVPFVLDIKEILSLVDCLGINGAKRRYKVRRGFQKQAEKRADIFLHDDDLKFMELADRLTEKDVISPKDNNAAPAAHLDGKTGGIPKNA